MDTVVFTDDRAIAYFTDSVALVKIDVDVDSLTPEQYHVYGLPTFVLLDADGVEIDRTVGFAETGTFLATLTDYTNGIGTLADLLRRAEADSSREMAYTIAEKYKWRGGFDSAAMWYNRIIAVSATDSLAAEARTAMGDMYSRGEDWPRAREIFAGVTEDFAGTEVGAWGHYYLHRTHLGLNDTVQALESLQTIVDDYPDLDVAEYAASRIETITGQAEESH